MRPLIIGLLSVCLTVACTHLSIERHAVGLYGTYMLAAEAGSEIIQSPEVPDRVKLSIQRADARAKPAADALMAALLSYRKFKSSSSADLLQHEIDAAREPITTLNEVAH